MIKGLYLHIPFCEKICVYCDFHKEIAKDQKKEDYIYRLIESIKDHQKDLQSLKTIYIGGGTPSNIASSLLEDLLKTIQQTIDVSSLEEYTIESNPNDVSLEKAKLYHKYGINRVSLGVQSFDEEILRKMNRSHQREDIYKSIDNLRQVGIENISIDLIFGFHKQNIKQVEDDLKEAQKLDVPHISYYALILEEKSVMYHLVKEGKIRIVDEDLDYLMYNRIIDTLTKNGYIHYEVSNFAKRGYASKHNLLYWQQADYLGLGSGAHSYINQKRFFTKANVRKYIDSKEDKDCIKYYPSYPLEDALLFGLRVLKGIHVPSLEEQHQCVLLEEFPSLVTHIESGLLTYEDAYIRFTKKGLMLSNLVFEAILGDHNAETTS